MVVSASNQQEINSNILEELQSTTSGAVTTFTAVISVASKDNTIGTQISLHPTIALQQTQSIKSETKQNTGDILSCLKTIIAISIIGMLAIKIKICQSCQRVYTRKAAHIPKDTKTHYVTRYHVMDMDTNQVVQVIIVVNTARIIEMGMLQDGLLQRMLTVMTIVRADQMMVAVVVHNRTHSHKLLK